MKRKMIAGIFVAGVLLLTACSGNTDASQGHTASNTNSVESILQAGLEEEQKKTISTPEPTSTPTPIPTEAAAEPEEEEEPVVLSTTEGIDVDLTSLSSTMVYSEVYNMMTIPEDYIGKVIKMEGAYSYYSDTSSGLEYHACIIQDATACCAQGVEFVPLNPEACPAEGGDVTVVGVFDTYMEGDYMYCTLRDAEIL